jgi:mannose/fructose/N-acetylgalactosamine-specific phosphotransferase system component IIC
LHDSSVIIRHKHAKSLGNVAKSFSGAVFHTGPVWKFIRRNLRVAVPIALLGTWLTVVIFVTTQHEYWRDEVRALSLARAALSPLDLYGLTQYDVHSILSFFILYLGKSVVDTPLVLP